MTADGVFTWLGNSPENVTKAEASVKVLRFYGKYTESLWRFVLPQEIGETVAFCYKLRKNR